MMVSLGGEGVTLRGADHQQSGMFSYLPAEKRVPKIIRCVRFGRWSMQRCAIWAWLKTVGGLRKTRHRGLARVGWILTFVLATYNLLRMRNPVVAPA
jgi:hypothetical protein